MIKAMVLSFTFLTLVRATTLQWDGQVAPALPPLQDRPASAAPPGAPAPSSTGNTPAQEPEAKEKVWARAPELEAAVAKAMKDFPGRYSIAVQDLTSGERWVLNPDERYHPASTIKVVVSLYALEQYRAGKLKWSDTIAYTPADYEPGSGSLEKASYGSRYSVEDLVGRALRHSNNIAVNMLGRHLGWQNIRDWSRTIDGELYRRPNGMPEVTLLSVLNWWLHLYRLSQTDPENAELLLKPLREVTYTRRIGAGLPKGVPHLHKFGSYDGNFHDSGIIYSERPYALVILTRGASEKQADAAIARATAAIHRVMTSAR
jgi:beta-lactamase class A